MRRSLASSLSCPSSESFGSLGPRLLSDLLSFGHRGHPREAGPSKVTQPGVDLVNMAAPPGVRACTIGTLKSVLLSAAVLVWIVEVAYPSRKHGML